jgi:hypothetical protein
LRNAAVFHFAVVRRQDVQESLSLSERASALFVAKQGLDCMIILKELSTIGGDDELDGAGTFERWIHEPSRARHGFRREGVEGFTSHLD